MANEHPFQVLFETLGRVPTAHAESVNRQAYEILSDILTMPVEKSGRCILLRAPRAGHGKTHLLSRIQHQLGASHEFVSLHAAFGCRIDAATVTDDTLRRLVRQLPASGGLTVLDLVTRRLFASALQPLVASGEVPCQDREGALTALRNRPIETFDFHHPNAVTAHWARENFEVLGQRLSLELAQRSGLPVSGISFWVDALFHFAAAPLESSNRVRVLAESVHAGLGMEMERLEALLGLLTLLMRVVLVADDLEGFSTDETAALRLAAFLGNLRQSVERLDVILSLNQDIWQSAFVPRLSDGLADRLSEVVVELEPLTDVEMEALLNSRVPGLGRRVLDRIDVDSAGTHARGLIRAAGMAWLKATAMDSTAASVAPAVVAPAFVMSEAEVFPVSPVVENEPFVAEAPAAPVVESKPPADESSPFTFAATVSPVEAAPEWPAPVFSVPPVAEIVAEPLTYHAPVDSPFQVSPPEPVMEPPSTPEWKETAQPFTLDVPDSAPSDSWNPPSAVVDHAVETPTFAPRVDSPFQAQAPAEWQEAAPTAPAYSARPHEEFIVPPVKDFTPVDSPFQSAPQPFNPEPPAPTFNPGGWQEPAPLQGNFIASPQHYDAPVQSPFQTAPQPYAPPFEPQEAPMSSPFSMPQAEPAPVFQASPEPVFNPPAPPAEVKPPPTTEETDRVDDLLRQFRERYGRGSL